MNDLTKREWELYNMLVGTGMQYKEIAYRMGCAVNTAKTNGSRLYDKLNVASRAEMQANEIKRLNALIDQAVRVA